MRRVIVNEWMPFDGVVQSAGADDGTCGGFNFNDGGWHLPYMDKMTQARAEGETRRRQR